MTTGTSRRRLTGLLIVAGAGLLFALLLLLVRYQWAPLESVDHGLAARSNGAVADHPAVVRVLTVVTRLGSNSVLWWVMTIVVVVLVLRRLYRMAAFLMASGLGAVVLDPTLKLAVGRLRPVVNDPIAHGTGNSFPSGHSLGSFVCYGALLLVFLPAVARRWRPALIAVAATLVLAVGVSRILLGVHYVSDVVGAWALGAGWLGLTVFAVELYRHSEGRRVPQPLAEGLAPDAAEDLKPAGKPAGTRTPTPGLGPTAAAIVVGWVLVFGAITGLGELVTRYGGGNLLGDHTIPHWFAMHRTATGTTVSLYLSRAGDTHGIMAVGLLAGAVALGTLRRWRPVLFLLVLMLGELTLFLATALIIGRPRPDVPQLDGHMPTSSYPSGHFAATLCLYTGIVLLAVTWIRSRWAWLTLVPAIAMPLAVSLSRLYRGMHHPTDLAGSIILAAAWLTVTWFTIRPDLGRTPPAPARAAEAEATGELTAAGHRSASR